MYMCVIVSTVDVNDCIFCVNEQQKVDLAPLFLVGIYLWSVAQVVQFETKASVTLSNFCCNVFGNFVAT